VAANECATKLNPIVPSVLDSCSTHLHHNHFIAESYFERTAKVKSPIKGQSWARNFTLNA